MKVTAWNNGSFRSTGAGYGLRVKPTDRSTFFSHSWSHAIIELPNGNRLRINLSRSFWRNCAELRDAGIGKWLLAIGQDQWPTGSPPVFTMVQVRGNHFKMI